jgi:hypothetical protein
MDAGDPPTHAVHHLPPNVDRRRLRIFEATGTNLADLGEEHG